MLPALTSTIASTRQFVLGGDGAANGVEDLVEVALLAPLDLLHDDQLLAAVALDGEDAAPQSGRSRGWRSLHGQLRCPADSGSRRG